MKNVFTILAAACLVLALGAGPSFGNMEVCNYLVADGGSAATAVTVGQVCVSNDGSKLFVEYHMNTGWCLTQTHTDVATSDEDIPQQNGNPIPGKFDQKETFASCVYEAGPYAFTLNSTNIVAAHAVVWDEESATTLNVVSSTNTDIIEADGITVTEKAVEAFEPITYPTCSGYSLIDGPNDAVWDAGIGSTYRNLFNSLEADWIWRSPGYPDPDNNEQIYGQVITFQETFSVPGLPTSSNLAITADNAYRALLNGALVGAAQLGTGFPGTLKETTDTTPQNGDWGVASQGWQTVESYALSGIMMGDNTLTIAAANEYMWNSTTGYLGKDYYYGNYNPPGPPVNQDPFPGTGESGQSVGDNICRNPAGLIFALSVDYYERSETAWGDGTEFGGRNWATYITYTYTPSP